MKRYLILIPISVILITSLFLGHINSIPYQQIKEFKVQDEAKQKVKDENVAVPPTLPQQKDTTTSTPSTTTSASPVSQETTDTPTAPAEPDPNYFKPHPVYDEHGNQVGSVQMAP